MKTIISSVRKKVTSSSKVVKVTHVTHQGFHLTYLGAAAAEFHGIYSAAAAGLFTVVLVSIIFSIAIEE